MADTKPKSLKDRMFVAYYLDSLDPQDAAIKAGFSLSLSKSKAYQWVSNRKVKPLVYDAVKDALEMRMRRLSITADRVAVEIEKLAFSNVSDFYDDNGDLIPPNKLPRDVAAAITEVTERRTLGQDGEEHVEIKYKTESKKGNLELLGKFLQMFIDKKEIEFKDKTEKDMSDDELDDELKKYGLEE